MEKVLFLLDILSVKRNNIFTGRGFGSNNQIGQRFLDLIDLKKEYVKMQFIN